MHFVLALLSVVVGAGAGLVLLASPVRGLKQQSPLGWVVVTLLLLAALSVAVVNVASIKSPHAVPTPAIGDQAVYYSGHGSGSATIAVSPDYVGGAPVVLIPGGEFAVAMRCVGSGNATVTVLPVKTHFVAVCSGPGSRIVSELYGFRGERIATPRSIQVSTDSANHWSLAVVNPQGSIGIADALP